MFPQQSGNLCKANSARVLQGVREKLPARAGKHHYKLQNKRRQLGPYLRSWYGHGAGDGEAQPSLRGLGVPGDLQSPQQSVPGRWDSEGSVQ